MTTLMMSLQRVQRGLTPRVLTRRPTMWRHLGGGLITEVVHQVLQLKRTGRKIIILAHDHWFYFVWNG
jgi:hypothetical protein